MTNYAFWCRIPSRVNFGDALTPWLINRITGQLPKFRSPTDSLHKYLVTGSVINLVTAPCTVWGAGIMNADDHIANNLDLLAVRGPLTRERALASGNSCPALFGDPALLLPRFYSPKTKTNYRVGLALHMADQAKFDACYEIPNGVKVIDMQNPITQVIDELCSCDAVACSSLHGLIASHAYGIPATWVEFWPLPSGDGSKFRDYLLSIGIDQHAPLQIPPSTLNISNILKCAIDAPSTLNADALWNACPFGGSP